MAYIDRYVNREPLNRVCTIAYRIIYSDSLRNRLFARDKWHHRQFCGERRNTARRPAADHRVTSVDRPFSHLKRRRDIGSPDVTHILFTPRIYAHKAFNNPTDLRASRILVFSSAMRAGDRGAIRDDVRRSVASSTVGQLRQRRGGAHNGVRYVTSRRGSVWSPSPQSVLVFSDVCPSQLLRVTFSFLESSAIQYDATTFENDPNGRQ
ncbi:uncharacterized protein LOC118647898 [Monomorium pharaonis]|uniref:uncharacterized protein LOC118647898 n=1 Tax=Monomorium pharaonis TaxID=307658 RepID=UPI001746990F|nr:uncharacterized protein LOC118647898 [Monomorium pharaonis]